MKRISARWLMMNLDVEQAWATLSGEFIVVFDDGEIVTNARETLYSFYAWDFHREYPLTPMLMKHHVRTVLGNDRLGSDTHLQLLGNVMWSTYDAYMQQEIGGAAEQPVRSWWHRVKNKARAVLDQYLGSPAEPELSVTQLEARFRDKLAEKIYRVTNVMYNDLTHKLEEYVVSLDITDFIEVMTHPVVKAANDALVPTQNSIDNTYAIIKKAVTDGKTMPFNPLSLAARSKLINISQLLQCVSAVGYRTDTDSNLFHSPVLRGFGQGLRKFHDSMIESRSAAKALIFSKTPLQQAEYFSRRLQLMAQSLSNLHFGDCGTTKTTPWLVRGAKTEAGELKRPGDLKQLVGKHYYDDEGKLRTIKSNDLHLIGKVINMRTVIHCAHPDPYGVCSTCYGELSLSIPEGTNIGQINCTSLAQKSSQNVLSVKHLDGSSVVDGIILEQEDRKFVKVGSDDNSYLLADDLKAMKVKLIIRGENAANLTDIMDAKDVRDLNITRVSELADIGIWLHDGKKEMVTGINTSLNRRLASMTHALLSHVRSTGWDVDERGNYTIDMTGWDWEQPILTLPLKHFNMSDHSRDIAQMLESSVDKLQERDKNASPDSALVELFDLVNEKLTVNVAVLDVVLLANMVTSMEGHDFGIPKPWTTSGLGIMKLTMAGRSLASTMAYEGHREIITDPLSYVETNRMDHPMDGVLMPAEVFGYKSVEYNLRN